MELHSLKEDKANANSFCIISFRFGFCFSSFWLLVRFSSVRCGSVLFFLQLETIRIDSILLIWFIINFIVTRHLRAIILVVGFYGCRCPIAVGLALGAGPVAGPRCLGLWLWLGSPDCPNASASDCACGPLSDPAIWPKSALRSILFGI